MTVIDDVLLIFFVVAIVLYWWDNAKSGELALYYCRNECIKASYQLLDASVSRQRIWLRKAPGGGLQVCRLYSFEYSGDKQNRQFGYIVIIGKQIVETQFHSKT